MTVRRKPTHPPVGVSLTKSSGRPLIVLALTLIVAMALAACGGSDDESTGESSASTTGGNEEVAAGSGEIADKYKNLTIGVAGLSAADEGEKLLEEALQEGAEEAGLEWDIKLAQAKGNPNLTGPAVESFVNQDVDGIVNIAWPPEFAEPALEKAADAEIPVFGMWTFGEQSPLVTVDYTPSPSIDEAALSGYMFNELYKQHPEGDIQLALINTNLAVLQGRPLVLKAMNELYPRVKIVDEAEVDLEDAVGSATNITNAFLAKDPDLDAIWTNYPPSGVPAAAAVQAKGKADQVSVYMHVGDEAGVKALEDPENPLKAMVLVDLDYQAYRIIEQMLLQFSGGEPSKLLSYEDLVPLKVFNKATVGEANGEGVAGGAGWAQNGGAWKQPMIDEWKATFGS